MRKFQAFAVALTATSIGAHAQLMETLPMAGDARSAEMSAMCDTLASMPSPPMSVDQCRTMIGAATRMSAASSDDSAQRPGDDAMSCDAIFAELQVAAGDGISDANSMRAEALVVEGTAMAERHADETTAFMVETQALGVVAGVAVAVAPNFVAAAIAAAWQARATGLGARQSSEFTPLRASANETVASSMDALNQAMMANPRFLRLGQLAMAKNCDPPTQARR